jgi:uncharacterized protein YuzE
METTPLLRSGIVESRRITRIVATIRIIAARSSPASALRVGRQLRCWRRASRQIQALRYKRDVRPQHEAKAMTEITYDAEADTLYVAVGRGNVERTKKTGPFVYDLDAKGQIVNIEIPSASTVLTPGGWKKARRPNLRQRVPAAERHRGFIFIRRFSQRDVESQ